VGPGPNVFSKSNVWTDSMGRLHLEIVNRSGTWTCAEVVAQASLGYGTYRVTYDTAVNSLDPNVVVALFTWSDNSAYANREIDIELSRWAAPNNLNAQYVVQPAKPSRMHRWETAAATPSTHEFRWVHGSVFFESYAGTKPGPSMLLQEWHYKSSTVPVPGGENPRMNLWLYQGSPPSSGQPVEVIVSSFEWLP
jgi:hypothetical protein